METLIFVVLAILVAGVVFVLASFAATGLFAIAHKLRGDQALAFPPVPADGAGAA
ncbi:hypothetical protein [Arenibaculum pallidiluteum]|uniref:hypothetical protein n=1 Tax=Arenibaculum pallidiluteum TaxID=2812559 RepID=UPI001A97AF60|nr:hypothetical protein [Arenibaculum pallidiluteum]